MIKPLQWKNLFAVWSGIFLIFILVCCANKGSTDQGELFIKVLDAPGVFQQVNIVVNRVSIHRAGTTADVGWTIASTNPSGSFDLLNLRNGRNLQLILGKVPVGTYDQIKINYGACTIIKDGPEQALNLDPAILPGNAIAYGFQIIGGQQLQLTFDFDVYHSVYKSGELYYFKPAIRIQNTLLSGSITGSVLDSGRTVVSANILTYTGIDSVSTSNDFPYGSFQLSDLPEGTYSVAVVPVDSLLVADTISQVSVVRQQSANLGAIHLKYK